MAPTQEGSWAAVVGVPHVGIAAAQHLGVVLERTMFIAVTESATARSSGTASSTASPATGSRASDNRSDLIGALSALVDGVDLVIMARRLMISLPSSVVRRLQARAQSRGTVLLIIGDPGSVSIDLRLMARSEHWQGIGTGHGHLRRRRVALELDGRRCGRPRRHSLWLPNDHGGLTDTSSSDDLASDDLTSHDVLTDDGVVVALRQTG